MSGPAGPEETARFEKELTERLPPGLAAALPEVPVVTLFVAVSLA